MRPETAHVIQILRSSLRALGYTNRVVEAQLGVSGGYLTRLFNGTMELRFEHIVQIAQVMGLAPDEFFHMVYPQPQNPPTESAQRLRAMFGPRLSPPGGLGGPEGEKAAGGDSGLSSAIEAEMERLMKKVFARFFGEFMSKDKAAGE
jgi:hypothetical protein